MNNNMDIRSLVYRQVRCFTPKNIFLDFLMFTNGLLLLKTFPLEKTTSTTEEQRKGNDYGCFSAVFRLLEADQASLMLIRDFVFNEQRFNRQFFHVKDYLKLFLVFCITATQHCNKTLCINETFVVDIHIVVCLVDFL